MSSKYGKAFVLILFYTLYKTWRMPESSFSHSFRTFFLFHFVSNTTSFFIHSISRFVLKKKLLTRCWFSLIEGPFCSLNMQIYILNACKWDREENLLDFCVDPTAFRMENSHEPSFNLISCLFNSSMRIKT